MNVIQTTIPEVLIIEPKVYGDDLAIDWPFDGEPRLAEKDKAGGSYTTPRCSSNAHLT